MDDKVKKYRNKHKRCKYCKYLEYHYRDFCGSWHTCEAKDKFISWIDLLPRIFCSCYEIEEDN